MRIPLVRIRTQVGTIGVIFRAKEEMLLNKHFLLILCTRPMIFLPLQTAFRHTNWHDGRLSCRASTSQE